MVYLRFEIEDRALAWFRYYPSNRTQSFCVASGTSTPVIRLCSVPQGSVIGPYKFTAYTEDLVDIIEQFSINHHFYTDDSQLQINDRIEAAQPALMNLGRCVCCQRLVFVKATAIKR